MNLIEGALFWAEQGVPVFPTAKDKRPLTSNGHLDATTDPQRITKMFSNPTVWGIGARMGKEAGIFAIDADTYKPGASGDSAKEYVERLQRSGLLPETRIHATQSGGRHYLLRADQEWPNCKPVNGVEVKGEGGYIIVPPTPGYTVETQGLAYAPPNLLADLKASRAAASARSIDILEQAVLSGDDFHDTLTQIAAKLAASGQSLVLIQTYLRSLMAASAASTPTHPRHDRWLPIMEDKAGELTRIVSSANAKFNPTVPSDLLREAAPAKILEMALNFPAQRIEQENALVVVPAEAYAGNWPFAEQRGYFGYEPLDVLNQKFVMYPILSEGEVTLISASPKAGKTLVSQTLAMHIAAGESFGPLSVPERRPVLYFALESQVAIKKRLAAWKQHHDPENIKYTEGEFPFYVSETPINLLDETARQNFVNKIVAADLWWREQGENRIGSIVIDTLTKAMPGGDQNSVEDTSAVFDVIARIKDAGIVAPVVIIHHNTKGGEQPRGSSNIQAEPDTLLALTKNEETGQLHLKVLMARSIDDEAFYVFDIMTEELGITEQGYNITAPVLLPAAQVADETGSVATAALQMEMKYKPLFDALVDYGPGNWSFKRIHHHFQKVLVGTGLYDRAGSLRANSAELSAFLLTLLPVSGRNIDGQINVSPHLDYNKYGKPLITFVIIRELTAGSQAQDRA